MDIESIIDKVKQSDYRISDHAIERMIQRRISRSEIEDAIARGDIIEEYPDDKYHPSCLIYGKTGRGKELHIQLSLPPAVVIITVYSPDPEEWIDSRMRRL